MTMRRALQRRVDAVIRRTAYKLGVAAGREAGLDENTADAVGHAFAARMLETPLYGAERQAALNEEVQRHAAP